MDKKDLAAKFFVRLGNDAGDFVADMIESEMDSDLVELLNQFGGQLSSDGMDQKRFQASLLIIGYLLRAHEDNPCESIDGNAAAEDPGSSPLH